MRGRSAFTRAVALLGPAGFAALIACPQPASRTSAFRVDIRSAVRTCEALEAETVRIPLTLANKGAASWRSDGTPPILVSYHILGPDRKAIRFENARFPLAEEVAPGRIAKVEVPVKAPLEAGSYFLEFDLVAEGTAWFKDRGSKPLIMPFKVGRKDWPEDRFELSVEPGPFTKIDTDVPEFGSLMKLIRVTLKHNEVSFEGKTGRVEGFSAGSGYPQIWIRDGSTIIPASRYFYPASYVHSWLDELLFFQGPDGSLPDWFDSRGITDKNTVETDQEASAVQAGREVCDLLGPSWGAKNIRGIPARERMEQALEFVWKNRLDVERGLILGAHTADWGDVEMEDGDERAVYAGETTRWTADIYDQSMFYQAANDLARMLDVPGSADKAGLWRKRAESVRRNADKRLWQEDKGFYRVHSHAGPWRHDLDEDSMFAMGGNTQAMISGLAGGPGDDKRRRIIEQVLQRQKEFGISTISGSLLPPYPGGFFRHPALDEPFEYQNGGQWDWFGGKLVLAMFESGFAREAREKFLEIARKNVANGGFYEWDTKDGKGRGSDFFSGSSGSLARALIEGYYGIRISADNLEIAPRLGLDRAQVHIYLPAAGRFAAYDYRVDNESRTIRLEIGCDIEHGPVLSILNPWAPRAPRHASSLPKDFEVRINGSKVPFGLEQVGNDEYIRPELLAIRIKKFVVEVRYLRPIE